MSPLYDGSRRVKEALGLQVHKKASAEPVWLSPNGKTNMWAKLLALIEIWRFLCVFSFTSISFLFDLGVWFMASVLQWPITPLRLLWIRCTAFSGLYMVDHTLKKTRLDILAHFFSHPFLFILPYISAMLFPRLLVFCPFLFTPHIYCLGYQQIHQRLFPLTSGGDPGPLGQKEWKWIQKGLLSSPFYIILRLPYVSIPSAPLFISLPLHAALCLCLRRCSEARWMWKAASLLLPLLLLRLC